MKKSYNKAFTLVELLAVIVILAIILVIAVPKIMDVINSSKKSTLETSVKMIASTAEKTKMQNTILGKEDEEITCSSVAKLSSNDYDLDNCTITFDKNNNASVTIKGKGKFEGLNVCGGTKNSVTAQKEECATDGKYFTYEFVETNKTIKITNYNTEGGLDVVIPSTIDGYTVVEIGKYAFYDDRHSTGLGIKSVIIPYGVITIGPVAFIQNDLSSITIPSSVTSIGDYAFSHNYLISITIPSSVTSIGDHAFDSNPLSKVELSNPDIAIGNCSFGFKEDITSHNLPDTYDCQGEPPPS